MKWLICPIGQTNRQAIGDEKSHIDQIVATLGLTDTTDPHAAHLHCTEPTRRAIFEEDKLARGNRTLRCLRDRQLEGNVHRS